MALFRRKKQDTVLPEVDKYYEGERRDRPVMAWLLALASIALVALIIVGLFLGGRWAYNKIANNDDEEIATTEPTDTTTFDGAPEDSDQSQNGNGSEQPATPAPTESNSSQNNSNNSGSTSSPTPSQSSNTSSTSTSQSNSNNLPGTGPEGLVAAFAVTSIVAGGAHYLLQRRKANQI